MSYELALIDLSAGEQKADTFLRINPNGRIPAMIGSDGKRTFESGAILIRLAEETGQFLPEEHRSEVLSWCFWQVGGLGPMIGQWGHFLNADGDNTYSKSRYLEESLRLLTVLETQLRDNEFIVGNKYTIADMMCWPWVKGGMDFIGSVHPEKITPFDAISAWVDVIDKRPKVQAALRALTNLKEGAF